MVYRLLVRIPIVSTILKIINGYVFEGDPRAMDYFAPARLWVKTLLPPISVSLLITLWLLKDFYFFPNWSSYYFSFGGDFASTLQKIDPQAMTIRSPFDEPGNLILSVFPNLLGFGIGVYALIFALAPRSLQFLQEHISHQISTAKRKQGSVLILNSSLAYPLIVIAVSLLPGMFQKMYPSSQLLIACTWILFWYGIVVLIELIGILFGLGEQDTLDKLTP